MADTNKDQATQQWESALASEARSNQEQYMQYSQLATTYGQQNQGIETNAMNINENYDTALTDLESNTQATFAANEAEAASRGLSSSASQNAAYTQTENARRNTADQILTNQQKDSRTNAFYQEQLNNSARNMLSSNPELFTQLVTDTTNSIIDRATLVNKNGQDYYQLVYGDSPILIPTNTNFDSVMRQVYLTTGNAIFGPTYSQDTISKSIDNIIKSIGL